MGYPPRYADRLPAALHLKNLVEHNQRFGQDKSREFELQGVLHDLSHQPGSWTGPIDRRPNTRH